MENNLKSVLKEYADFPKKGVNFVDIHPLMLNHEARQLVVDHLVERYKDAKLDGIVCMESRGYYLGIPLAFALKIPFIPLRKPGKLPGKVHSASFNKEYGNDVLEIQDGILPPGSRVVLSDDLLATGGTAAAAIELVQQVQLTVVECFFLIELKALNGAKKLNSFAFYSLLKYE